jgi:propanol-preferring alcohol dehydrogenase
MGAGNHAQIKDVPKPTPGPGQVVIRVGGAGVCHSDLHVMEEDLGFSGEFTLGHENAGWISEIGSGTVGFKEGDAVAVYGPWGCGHCHACQLSFENYCENWAEIGTFGGGLGLDGGMAEFMLVPSTRFLVPLGRLSPVEAAPLTDAALTPYHAIKRALPRITPDTTVVVLGVGGLGHMAVQILKAVTSARLIAGDVAPDKLTQAKALGADEVVNTGDAKAAAEQIRKLVGARGAAFVLDCVGVQPTIDLGAQILGRDSIWTIAGLGGGHHDFHHGSTPYGCTLSIPYWGARAELIEVIAMARDGRIRAEITQYPLDRAIDVYGRLKAGQIHGRAVLTPSGGNPA